jgi:membrane protein DedA with SNARE-associated domain
LVAKIIGYLAHFVILVISSIGYGGIVLTMAIESACIPLPSEIILPFSGYLVSTGRFNIHLVALAGAGGCLLGSWAAYFLGSWGGRPLVERYGRYVLISKRDLRWADSWFTRYGDWAIFFSRLLPVIRTFISLPAGVAKMRFWSFSIYTFLGSWIWSYALAYIGFYMGERWETLRSYFHQFDVIIGILVVIGAIWYIRRHFKNQKEEAVRELAD